MRIKTFTFAFFTLCVGAGFGGACSATGGGNDFKTTGTNSTSGDTFTTSGGEGGLGIGVGGSSGSGAINPPCDFKDAAGDHDGDGFTVGEGDCNDCSIAMNPGAEDFPGNSVDEDCNGAADDDPTACDANLAVDSSSAIDGAKALGLCKMASGASWGLVSAEYQAADGQPLGDYDFAGDGHGILTGFGNNVHPQEGQKLLALSSGAGRQPNDVGYQPPAGYDKGYTTSAPAGYPKESPSCPGVTTGEPHDSAGLFVKIKTPTNAKSLKFNLNFYTYEWPNYICSMFNDFFVAIMTPTPAGQQDGNISFDTQGNLISVNAGFLQVCGCDSGPPCITGGLGQPKSFDCALGNKDLAGTGFDQDDFGGPNGNNSAATGWLETTTPVQQPGGEISLLFAIWDSGDGILDSTVLLDNFTFAIDGAETGTVPIGVPK